MDLQNLLSLVCALALALFVMLCFETSQVRRKVARLQAYLVGQKWRNNWVERHLPVKTRAKSYLISLVGFVVFVGLGLIIFKWLRPGPYMALDIIIALLLLSYAWVAFDLDRFHVEIEKITRKVRKR